MAEPDPHGLSRFLEAQEHVYATALAELRAGRKESHWMWFVFPQMRGLGHSPTALHYGITGRPEAEAYLGHPVLCPRLRDCTAALLPHAGQPIRRLLGSPDDLKFRSCMTLFAEAGGPEGGTLFRKALDIFCEGRADERTLTLLRS